VSARTLPTILAPATLLACLALAATAEDKRTTNPANPADSVLKFQVKDIDGKPVDLAKYEGKVLLIVNVASQCGLTPQYTALEAAYEKYKDKGLVILGFPANEFGHQEPGSNEEIKTFCSSKFNVTFPMFSKIVVKGEGIDPLYKYLTSKETNPKFAGEISWNFAKFLVNRKGEVIGRFDPRDKPDSEKVSKAIEAALDAAK
jgi:glutathione peroxidase